MLTWVEDFRKRMDDEESKQSKEELDSEQRNLFMPDGLQNRTKRKRTTKNLENYSKI
jgi:hypothetical protein